MNTAQTLITLLQAIEVDLSVPVLIPDSIKEPDGSYCPSDLPEKVQEIEDMANEILINGGGCNYAAINELRKAGYSVICEERDSFGWLIGSIVTKKGKIFYG